MIWIDVCEKENKFVDDDFGFVPVMVQRLVCNCHPKEDEQSPNSNEKAHPYDYFNVQIGWAWAQTSNHHIVRC